ncbi:2-phospho-L-lactate guanylyltransferase [Saccharothrix luteola]|uniref:2-phospho-L-lactate guanylyltransferase n=1 Tax=Saccharothrix luteola TaxID=2893018 RepID=UPI001E6031E7|nr:2-phospho-L-lactate guanylyltransferase [Saccharothrix luteola]MCC8251657.1 2-phospho-L-lactate guanylyltransferase [Saccharothrix luteola]
MDLVVPVKGLARAKTRLADVAADPVARAALALAFALDTLTAVTAAAGVRRVLVVTSDPAVVEEVAALGVESTPDPGEGLNAAVRAGAGVLRRRDPAAAVGVLHADLPALRPAELSSAIASADGRRAFCADRQGTGTTLLIAAPGTDLNPRLGVGSAQAHEVGGAVSLTGDWPSLRCDVDTGEDLSIATALGLGPHSATLVVADR